MVEDCQRQRLFPIWAEIAAVLSFIFLATNAVLAADGVLPPGPTVGRNDNGQLEVFKIGDNGTLYHRWQKPSNGAWAAWSPLGGSLSPGFAIVNDLKGEMEIFGVDRESRNLEWTRQLATNSLDWSPWSDLGGVLDSTVAAARNRDGRIVVFVVDAATERVKYLEQTADETGWSPWADLGGAVRSGLAVGKNRDGRLELFGIAAGSGALVHCWQLQANSTNWSGWASLGGAIRPGYVVARNLDGIVDVFGINRTNGSINRISQMGTGDSLHWTQWKNFGSNVEPGLAIARSGDKRLELFAVKDDDLMLMHRWELFTNIADKWSPWTDMGQKAGSLPAAGVNEDSNLQVFVSDPDDPDSICYRRQISGGSDWLDWSSMDEPDFAYAVRSWQTDEGLPDNSVQAIAQSADGFLWVGTQGGLARFDGNNFVCYTASNTPALKNSSITALCAGKDGSLWIGTDGGGLVRLHHGIFSCFSMTNGLAGNEVRVIYQDDDGTLWIGTTTGMSRYRDGEFRTYTERDGLLSATVRCIYQDQDKDLWIATGKGLNRLRRDGVMDCFVMPDGLPNNSVRAVCQDRGGRVWIGSNNGLLWYDWFWGVDFYAYNTSYGLSDPLVSAICEDGEGNLWVGTYSGLNRFRDGRFYSQPDSDGQPFDKVNTLFVDHEGNIWVGSREGLTRLTPKPFFTYTTEDGLTHNNIMAVLEDKEHNVWIGTWGGGLDEMQGDKILDRTLAGTNGLSQNLILSLCEGRDGSLWAGADFDGGLIRIKDGRTTRYTWHDGLIDAGLRVLCQDSSGDLLIGTDRGLSCLRNGKFISDPLTEALANKNIRDICQDESGAIWFGTENGLGRWQDGHFTLFTTADGLSASAVTALCVDDDNTLWIGTSGGGLNRYRNGRFTSYTTRQGLFSDEILGIVEDRGWLWMSSSQGIFRVREKDLDAFDDGKIETLVSLSYGKNDGMESSQCNGGGKPSAWKSNDGRLWFPTSKGLVTVNPADLPIDEEPPSVFIETVSADQKEIDNGRAELAGPASVLARLRSPLDVPPGHGEVEFRYASLNYSAPEKARFRYKLDGVDPDWVDAGVRRVAYYKGLAPGLYRFDVEACNQDGVWNEAGASIALFLEPHYWQVLWVRGLSVVLLAGGICAAALFAGRRRMERKVVRLEQEHAVERERGRIARDMHDQIGAGLTQIGLLGEFARRASSGKNGDALRHVEKICDTARELAQTLDEMVWTVNPRNDTLNKLGLYLAAYAEEFFQATSIRCLLDVPPGLPNWPVSAEVRHNLFLTVKEALNNIVKHSHASEASLRLSIEGSELELIIQDNGAGFPASHTNGSRNGLSNMQERVRELGGTLAISSDATAGTRIRLRVPISSRQ